MFGPGENVLRYNVTQKFVRSSILRDERYAYM